MLPDMAAMCLHCLVSVFTQSGIADFNSTHLELSTLMWWIQIVSMMLVVVTIFPLSSPSLLRFFSLIILFY